MMRVFGLAMLAPTCLVAYLISNGNNEVAIAANIVFYISAITLYLYPSVCIVFVDSNPPRSVFVINLLTGWTLIGWCVAYYLALCNPNNSQSNELPIQR